MHGTIKLQGQGREVLLRASWDLLWHCPTQLTLLSLFINPSFSSPPPSLCRSHCSSSAQLLTITSHTAPVSLSPRLPFSVFWCISLFLAISHLFCSRSIIYIGSWLFLFFYYYYFFFILFTKQVC